MPWKRANSEGGKLPRFEEQRGEVSLTGFTPTTLNGLVPQKFRIPISFTLPPFQTREGFSRLASNVCVVDCRSH